MSRITELGTLFMLIADDLPLIATGMDLDFYQRQAALLGITAPDDAAAAAGHYLAEGEAAGLSPHPFFAAAFYRRRHPDVATEPFCHFLRHGLAEGRRPHPLLRPLPSEASLRTGRGALAIDHLFDEHHYLTLYPDLRSAGWSAIDHYLHHGALERRVPHPLFSPAFYQQGIASEAIDLYADYLISGAGRGLDPHPLFMGGFAAAQGGFGGDAADVFSRFLADPWAGRSPYPLFDVPFYRDQVRDGFGYSRNPLIHYLTEPSAAALPPHPLFDVVHYRAQSGGPVDQPCLLHYAVSGAAEGFSPHPLFDPATFEQGQDEIRVGQRPPALVRYLLSPPTASPHYLLDAATYLAGRSGLTRPVLLDYLSRDDRDEAKLHPLFDLAHYLASAREFVRHLRRRTSGAGYWALRDALSAQAIRRDPLGHYLEHGWRAGLSPHNSFDPVFYRQQVGEVAGDPLAHYLRDGGKALFSPSPVFDLTLYLAIRPDCDPVRDVPYRHFRGLPDRPRPATNSLIDADHYLRIYPDLRRGGFEPVRHFLEHGAREGRRPNAAFSALHALDLDPERSLAKETAAGLFLKHQHRRPKLLFIGHEAGRSGAPLILLRLVEALARQLDCELHTILAAGGALEAAFRRVSHTFVQEPGRDARFEADGSGHEAEWRDALDRTLAAIGLDEVAVAVCNTAECRAYAAYLAARGVPVVSLVHEPADYYTAIQLISMLEASRTVIYPSRFTAERVFALAQARADREVTRGQGLLHPYIGKADRAAARRSVRSRLGLPDDAVIVLGCGTVEHRKGVDLFVDVAGLIAAVRDDVYLVWVGAASSAWGSTKRWADLALERNGAAERVRFVPAQEDVGPFYLAADVMLLPSRLDPFPCVVHEGMAAGLPIVGFQDCSGAAEALGEAGVMVPALDVAAMARAVLDLLDDPARRSRLGALGIERVERLWNNADYVRDVLAELDGVARLPLARRPPLRYPHGGPKVFLLQPDWSISGVNSFADTLARGLRERGMDARFLFTRGRFTPLDQGHEPDVPATYLQPELDRPDSVWAGLLAFLHRERPCVVVPNYDYLASGVAPVAPEGVTFVGIAHSDDVEHYAHVYRLGLYWSRIVAVSDRIAEKIAELNPAFRPKLSTIRYGVAFSAPAGRAAVDRRAERAGREGANAPIRLVYSGRLVQAQKRILEFVRLADELQAARVPFHLTLIGDGPQADRLRSLMAAHVATGSVRFTGRVSQPEVAELVADADLFILLSDFEGLPLAMLEAMALGVIPVIRDLDSGAREVITDGVNGHLCSRWSLTDMVGRIAALQADPDRRRAMALDALETVPRQQLDSRSMVSRYADLIADAFATMAGDNAARPVPHAFDAPHKGISVPTWLYPRFAGPDTLLDDDAALLAELDGADKEPLDE